MVLGSPAEGQTQPGLRDSLLEAGGGAGHGETGVAEVSSYHMFRLTCWQEGSWPGQLRGAGGPAAHSQHPLMTPVVDRETAGRAGEGCYLVIISGPENDKDLALCLSWALRRPGLGGWSQGWGRLSPEPLARAVGRAGAQP